MAKVGKLDNVWVFECPGCKFDHPIDERWEFNGDAERPTFRPSLLVNGTVDDGAQRCHSYITDGRIQFLEDCHHELRGQTVPMADYES